MKKQLNVLIAENDMLAKRTLTRSLSVHKNWIINTAQDEEDLFRLLQQQDVHVLILENLFPGRALNVLHKLQSTASTAHIPVLAVTGSLGPQADELLAAGATRHVCKPIGGRSLTRELRDMLRDKPPVTGAPRAAIVDPERISALEETSLLDTSPYPQFDRLTEITARVLGVPLALVSLVDKDRQYFLSHHGLVEPWASSRETPLSHSFCQWVVAGKEPLVVNDARQHEVLVNNLAIKNLGVVAYAGQPITVSNGQVIGSLCAIDGYPRSWTFEELATLRDLAELTETWIAFEDELSNPESMRPTRSVVGEPGRSALVQIAAKGISAIARMMRQPDLPLNQGDRHLFKQLVETLRSKQRQLSLA